ncbi:MAG: sulfatase-like hydrolase/transferase [Bacteroidales bacterium]
MPYLNSTVIKRRYHLLTAFIITFLLISFVIRLVFFIIVLHGADIALLAILKTFIVGAFFDIGVVSFFSLPYAIYLAICPNKYVGSRVDKTLTYIGLFFALLIILFSFLAEIEFWLEFERRFNFIAVDYLIYTYEVVKNINESYPLPALFGGMSLILAVFYFLYYKLNIFKNTFNNTITHKEKLVKLGGILVVVFFFSFFIRNEQAEWSTNRDNNELSKAGIYSFFSAFRNNELKYTDFYKIRDITENFKTVRAEYKDDGVFTSDSKSIRRSINNINGDQNVTTHQQEIIYPNIICFCVESLSGSFLKTFGAKDDNAHTLDSLANNSFFFTNLYANGTRTVRAMEALTLSVPPTPGRSIVKRQNNQGLYTIGQIFKEKGYTPTFFYGGDGYFDNMNTYFGGNGFNIVDRGKRYLIDKKISTKRTIISDDETTFENAWGICDEDLFNKILKETDIAYDSNQRIFDFVMTTSNHRPYTYPDNTIDIPSGTGREGGIKYTDYAFRKFFQEASKKPWYKNTIFVIVADHCASSAGRWTLDIKNYHIPAMIINLEAVANIPNQKIDKLCSQVDIFPTLFGLLNWSYTSNFYGRDVMKMQSSDERAFVGNYRKLGLVKKDTVIVLTDHQEANTYLWHSSTNELNKMPDNITLENQAISAYQTASYLYHNNGFKNLQK